MIPSLTDPSVSFVPSPVAAAGGGGPEFEASLIGDPEETTENDKADDGDMEEAASDAVMIEPVPLEQFVQKREIAPAGTDDESEAQVPVGAVAPSATMGAQAIFTGGSEGVLASSGGDQSLLAAPHEHERAAAEPAGESHLTEGVARRGVQGNGADDYIAEVAVPKLETAARTMAAEAKDPVDTPLSAMPDQVSPEITWHQAREMRFEPALQPAPLLRTGAAEARHVSRQLAKHVVADQDRIEVTLTPDELGRVRLVMTPGDVPTVAVYADNQQTLDLLRRNAEVLMRELSDTGFGGASLSFGDGGEQDQSAQPKVSMHAGGIDVAAGEKTTSSRPISDRRLDIRI